MPNGGGSSSDSGGSGKGRQDAESQYGAGSVGSYDSSQNTSDRSQDTSNSFDYETEAYKGDVNIDAGYGPGKITSAIYDAKTGKTNIEQTVGIIDTATYQTAQFQAYFDFNKKNLLYRRGICWWSNYGCIR